MPPRRTKLAAKDPHDPAWLVARMPGAPVPPMVPVLVNPAPPRPLTSPLVRRIALFLAIMRAATQQQVLREFASNHPGRRHAAKKVLRGMVARRLLRQQPVWPGPGGLGHSSPVCYQLASAGWALLDKSPRPLLAGDALISRLQATEVIQARADEGWVYVGRSHAMRHHVAHASQPGVHNGKGSPYSDSMRSAFRRQWHEIRTGAQPAPPPHGFPLLARGDATRGTLELRVLILPPARGTLQRALRRLRAVLPYSPVVPELVLLEPWMAAETRRLIERVARPTVRRTRRFYVAPEAERVSSVPPFASPERRTRGAGRRRLGLPEPMIPPRTVGGWEAWHRP